MKLISKEQTVLGRVKQTVKRKKSKVNRIVNVAIVAMCCYLAGSCVVLFMDQAALKSKTEAVNQQCEEQKILNDEMQGLIDQGSDKEFIVKMAREKLGLIFPDERVFFNTSGNQ